LPILELRFPESLIALSGILSPASPMSLLAVLLLFFQTSLALRSDARVDLRPEHLGVRSLASQRDTSAWSEPVPDGFGALPQRARMEFGHAAPPTILRVVLDVPHPGRWWFVSELRTPRLVGVRVGSQVLGRFGEGVPFAQRPVATTDLSVPLDLKGPRDTLYLRVHEPKGPCVLEAHLTPDAIFPDEVQDRAIGNALVLGYMLAIFLVSAFLWIAVREKAFGWYVAYFAAALSWLAVKRGVAFAWIWPGLPSWNDGASVALAYLAIGCFALFLLHILDLKRHHPDIARWLTLAARLEFALVPVAFFCLLEPNRLALNSVGWFQVILPVTLLAVLLLRVIARDRLAFWLLVAFLPLAMGMVYGTLVEFGLSAGGPSIKSLVLTIGALAENTLTTLILIREVHRRERARLALEREFHTRVVERADEYFREVASELHDDLGQRSFSIRMQLFATRGDDEDLELMDSISSLHEDLRRLSHRLHPSQLREQGLEPALENLCQEFSKAGRSVRFRCLHPLEMLDSAASLHLYRIAQEALVNAQRHGKADRVDLTLEVEGRSCVMEVTDNGGGFEPEEKTVGYGLAGMRSRAQALGGRLEIRSRRGSGTFLKVAIPAYDRRK
jgi:signal transduction histidine kinase